MLHYPCFSLLGHIAWAILAHPRIDTLVCGADPELNWSLTDRIVWPGGVRQLLELPLGRITEYLLEGSHSLA